MIGVHLCLSLGVSGQTEGKPAGAGRPGEAWTLEEAVEVLRHSLWAQEKFILIPTGRMTRYPVLVGNARVAGEVSPERLPAVYLVRWESAEPVAQAFARLAELGESTLATFLARPPADALQPDAEHYVITVKAKEPPRPLTHDLFGRFKPAELTARAALKTSHGTSVKPARALRSGAGAAAAVHFYFPRRESAGPLIAPGDSWIEFSFTGRYNTTLKVRFKQEALPRAGSGQEP